MKEQNKPMSHHLEVLRWHLIRGLAAMFLVSIGMYLMGNYFFDNVVLAHSSKDFFTYRFVCNNFASLCFYPEAFTFEAIGLEEQFITHIKVSLVMGFALSFPYVFWEIWSYIKPALYPNERKAAKGMVFICSCLFFLGILFGYFIIAPFAVTFLSRYNVSQMVEIVPRLNTYVNLLTMIILPVGLIFELPVIVYFLAKVGLLTSSFMKRFRKHAVVVILILASFLTPPDVITQFLIGIPFYMLYEIGIIIAKRVEKRRTNLSNN